MIYVSQAETSFLVFSDPFKTAPPSLHVSYFYWVSGSPMKRKKGYPFLVNDDALTQRSVAWAKTYLGAENVVELPIRMTAEDFAYYSQEMPACFYRLGTGNQAKNITSSVHTDTFDVDEVSLEVGMGLMAYLAMMELETV